MQAEKGLLASDLKGPEVKKILETCFGAGQKARNVRDIIQGKSAGVDEAMVTFVMQGVQQLARKSGHYVEFIYERAAQVAECFIVGSGLVEGGVARGRTCMRDLEGGRACLEG